MSLSSLSAKFTASVSVPAIEHDDLQRASLARSGATLDSRAGTLRALQPARAASHQHVPHSGAPARPKHGPNEM